jgi:hypothetical protein
MDLEAISRVMYKAQNWGRVQAESVLKDLWKYFVGTAEEQRERNSAKREEADRKRRAQAEDEGSPRKKRARSDDTESSAKRPRLEATSSSRRSCPKRGSRSGSVSGGKGGRGRGRGRGGKRGKGVVIRL